MAINSRISDKIKELTQSEDDRFMRNKLISILNRAEEGKHLKKEIDKIMQEL